MTPFFFGAADKALFGVYHPPRGRQVRDSGVVLCYPIGQEYMRAHRAFRQLAMLLSRVGHHVFRFDYFGTGDSSGDGAEGALEQWRDDIATAVQELRDTAAINKISLVGLRLGGTLAAYVATTRNDLDEVVLWDPIVSGQAYVDEMLAAHSESLIGTAERNQDDTDIPDEIGVMGFPLSGQLRRAIARIDLSNLDLTSLGRVLLVVSSARDEYLRMCDRVQGHAETLTYRCIPSLGNWNEVDQFGSALIPQAIIQDIVGWLS